MEVDDMLPFVKDETTGREMMRHAGPRANYNRTHLGQGTRNLCACLDDMYFELLLLAASPIASASKAIGLGARGRSDGAPIELAWRGEADLDYIPYAATFPSPDMSIPVARDSLDKTQPFAFQSPSDVAPINCDESLVGQSQRSNHCRLEEVIIRLPSANNLLQFMNRFEQTHFIVRQPSLNATLSVPSGSAAHRFT